MCCWRGATSTATEDNSIILWERLWRVRTTGAACTKALAAIQPSERQPPIMLRANKNNKYKDKYEIHKHLYKYTPELLAQRLWRRSSPVRDSHRSCSEQIRITNIKTNTKYTNTYTNIHRSCLHKGFGGDPAQSQWETATDPANTNTKYKIHKYEKHLYKYISQLLGYPAIQPSHSGVAILVRDSHWSPASSKYKIRIQKLKYKHKYKYTYWSCLLKDFCGTQIQIQNTDMYIQIQNTGTQIQIQNTGTQIQIQNTDMHIYTNTSIESLARDSLDSSHYSPSSNTSEKVTSILLWTDTK